MCILFYDFSWVWKIKREKTGYSICLYRLCILLWMDTWWWFSVYWYCRSSNSGSCSVFKLLPVWYDYLSSVAIPSFTWFMVLPEVIKLWFIDIEFPWLAQHWLFAAACWLHLNNISGSGILLSLFLRYGNHSIFVFHLFDLFQELFRLMHQKITL